MLEKKSLRGSGGSRQRGKGAFLGPCLFFNLLVYSLDCALWWVFIGGQVAFNIKIKIPCGLGIKAS